VKADLLTFDPDLEEFRELINAAVQARQVLVPVATKVLHRKRRGFIPMLDTVVMGHFVFWKSWCGRRPCRTVTTVHVDLSPVAIPILWKPG
jgi:hypothetical protein